MSNNRKLSLKVLSSCFIATSLEIFDFVIFAFLMPVFYKNYLNFLDANTAMIASYALFAVGFVFRPLGALVFGYIGDKYGRKTALVLSVSMMGTASLTMFCLPPYEILGVWSCYIIVLVRIIQGLSVGGEYSGSLLFAIEHSDKNKVGMVGAIIQLGSTAGILLSMFVSGLLQSPELPEYAWRFAFLVGFGLSVVGYFIRKKLGETPVFSDLKKKKNDTSIPLLKGFKLHKMKFFMAIFLAGANTSNFYFYLVYVPNYVKELSGANLSNAGLVMTSLTLAVAPVVGYMSDKYGRLSMIILASCVATLCGGWFLWGLVSVKNVYLTNLILLVGASVVSLMMVSINIFVLEMFPAECRFSCGGVSYSIGAAIFGGTTPMACSMIIERFGDNAIFIGLYVLLISLFGMISALLLQYSKYRGKSNSLNTREDKALNTSIKDKIYI